MLSWETRRRARQKGTGIAFPLGGCWLALARLAAAAVIVTGASFASYGAARTVLADQYLNQVQTDSNRGDLRAEELLHRSIHARPDLEGAREALVERLLYESPDRARVQAQRAIQLDPQDWHVWQALALIDFEAGDSAGVQRDILQSESLEHGFAAHFQAANLKLVMGDESGFWEETRQALQIAPVGELPALLRLGLRDPERFVQILPVSRPDLIAATVFYLSAHEQIRAALAAWSRLRCRPQMESACAGAAQQLVRSGLNAAWYGKSEAVASVSSLLSVWNNAVREDKMKQPLASSGQIMGGRLDGTGWGSAGLGWQAQPGLQVTLNRDPRDPFASVTLDGSEAERTDFFSQMVAVQPGQHFQLSYRSRATLGVGRNGVAIEVWAAPTRMATSIPAALGPKWRPDTGVFDVPAGVDVIVIRCVYQRPKGERLAVGDVDLADVSLVSGRVGPAYPILATVNR